MRYRLDHNRRWMSLKKPGAIWVGISVLCYLAACFLPAFNEPSTSPSCYGWECLFIGAAVAFEEISTAWDHFQSTPVISIWWSSNPLYFLAIGGYLAKYRRIAAVLGCLAVLPAIYFEFESWTQVRSGCVLWVSSLQVFALNAVWHVWADRRELEATGGSTTSVDTAS